MKPCHYFEANFNTQFNEYKFDEILPCNAALEIDTVKGTYYRHIFEYPDAMFYVYCNKKLSGQEEQKLFQDLLTHSPQG
ncbi:hypothetical protein [Acinetobacter sp. ABJ_C5_2]|uniref:hypothetical protein n=1 Tax=Acinetobacter sp. ABJ_C5_2 TaxID=3376992 RepID=UPI0037CB5B6E